MEKKKKKKKCIQLEQANNCMSNSHGEKDSLLLTYEERKIFHTSCKYLWITPRRHEEEPKTNIETLKFPKDNTSRNLAKQALKPPQINKIASKSFLVTKKQEKKLKKKVG